MVPRRPYLRCPLRKNSFLPQSLHSQLTSQYFPQRILGITCKRALVSSQTELKSLVTESLSLLVSKHLLPSRNVPSPTTHLCSLQNPARFFAAVHITPVGQKHKHHSIPWTPHLPCPPPKFTTLLLPQSGWGRSLCAIPIFPLPLFLFPFSRISPNNIDALIQTHRGYLRKRLVLYSSSFYRFRKNKYVTITHRG